MTDDLIKDLQEYKERIEVAGEVFWENPQVCQQAVDTIIEVRAQIAAAFEMASALPGTSDWRWRFEPSWSAHELAEAIRALTPADAAEALRQIRTEAYRAGQEAMQGQAAKVASMFGQGTQGIKTSRAIEARIRALPIKDLPEDRG